MGVQANYFTARIFRVNRPAILVTTNHFDEYHQKILISKVYLIIPYKVKNHAVSVIITKDMWLLGRRKVQWYDKLANDAIDCCTLKERIHGICTLSI